MKKKILIFVSMIIIVYFVGCGHQHDYADATCTEAKTCTVCGETEGEAIGHDWIDADCSNPKTCKVCREIKGEAIGHNWIDADCNNPKICKVCGETEGDALGHLVKIGLCNQCNEVQSEIQLQAIISYYNDCVILVQLAGDTILSADRSSISDIYGKILVAQAYLNVIGKNLQKVYEMCKDYRELKNIANGAKLVMALIPASLENNNINLMSDWMQSYNSFLDQIILFCTDTSELLRWMNN